MNDTDAKTRVTGTDLAQRGLEALDVTQYEQMPVDNRAVQGEVSEVDWMKIFDVGKALAAMKDGMPAHVRGSWGIGCRVAADAHMWKMNPFAVADQTFVVNGRLGYMSQFVHARINSAAPLAHRLICKYTGEGQERQCTVIGQFTNGDERDYTTPKLKDIKVQNSPLWKNDVDQQLWYFAVRAWGRKWVPEVVIGLYTKEELEADKTLGYETPAPGLSARLKGSAPSGEGHDAERVTEQLDKLGNGGSQAAERRSARQKRGRGKSTPKAAKRASDAPKGKAPRKAKLPENVSQETKVRGTAATAVAYPSNVAEYVAYARRWIKAETDKVELGQRWAAERKMRNDIGLTADDRAPLEDLMKKQLEK